MSDLDSPSCDDDDEEEPLHRCRWQFLRIDKVEVNASADGENAQAITPRQDE